MIEKTILDHLSAVLDAPCGTEVPPDPPPRFVVLEKTGETRKDCIRDAILAVQSYAPTLLEAATLSEAVVAAMLNAVQLPSVAAVELNGNYNFTDTATKQYRYQAVFDVTHYEQKG